MRCPSGSLLKLIVVCLITVFAQTVAAAAGFLIPPMYSVGQQPSGVVAADFNGDGKLDLAVVQQNDHISPGNLSILLGNGDGTLRNAVFYDLGTDGGSTAIAVGDFNHDGKLDLAVPFDDNPARQGLGVLLGNGDGTFQKAGLYNSGGNNPQDIALGDFNNDGNLDVMLSISSSKFATLLLGDGTGKFGPATRIPLQFSFGGQVLVGDFNQDGKLDAGLITQGNVAVLLGKGDGTFQPAVYYDSASFPDSLAVADVDLDGILDLVAGNESGEIDVMRGKGDGTFRAPVKTFVAVAPHVIVIQDINGDGKLDLIFLSIPGNSVGVLLGNGNGTFQSTTLYNIDRPLGIAVADLNQDGHKDLVVSDGNQGTVAVLEGNGNGSFPAPVVNPLTVFADASGPVAVGDFNGDGKLDAATISIAFSDVLYVFLGKGDGTLSLPTTSFPTTTGEFSIAAGDLNADGKLDIVVGLDKGVINVFIGNGDGTFQSPTVFQAAEQVFSLALADLNGDGKLDIAAACFDIFTNFGHISILLNDGNGGFLPATNYQTNREPQGITVGDFNNDGFLDLAAINLADSFDTMLGNGDGTFQPAVVYSTPYNVPDDAQIRAADLNRDGNLDILAAMGGNGLGIALGIGDGSFQPVTAVMQPTTDLAVVDFNGDGRLDVGSAIPGFLEGLGNGDGTFLPATSYGTGANYLAIGNFNGDNATDVVLSVYGGLTVLLNTGGTTETLTSSMNPSKLNQPVTFTATLSASVVGSPGGIPSGRINFMDGSTLLGQVTLTNGQASFTTSNLKAGTHRITAVYSGDANFNRNSAKLRQVVM